VLAPAPHTEHHERHFLHGGSPIPAKRDAVTKEDWSRPCLLSNADTFRIEPTFNDFCSVQNGVSE
jgi:hypothetical protein